MPYGTVQADKIQGSINSFSPDSSFFRNRIINGAMVIDQRNAGVSVTIPFTNTQYTLDRWAVQSSQASKFSVQQNAGSVTPPVGFSKYIGVTSLSAHSLTTSDYFTLFQIIEGFNMADFAWGTASAKTVTLSFWVRSSLTGTFGGSLRNGTPNRSYPFTYTINSTNTWEKKTITVVGDTSGTWATDNSGGMIVTFGLGLGSTFSGTAGAWTGSNIISVTGATSVVSTNGATFYITGVQLEVGSTDTSFDYRPYGTELALCQRYYEKSFDTETAPSNGTATTFSTTNGMFGGYGTNRGGGIGTSLVFKVPKRATPSIGYWGNSSGYWAYTAANDGTFNWSGNLYLTRINQVGAMTNQQQADGVAYFVFGHWTASAEL